MSRRKQLVILAMSMIFIFSAAVILCPDIALAESTEESAQTVAEATVDFSEYTQMIQMAYNVFKYIMLPLGAVSVALGALRMVTGSEEDVAKGKKQIVLSLIAVVVISLIPAVVQMGVSYGKLHAWTPTVGSVDGMESRYVGAGDGAGDANEESSDEQEGE